MSNRGPGKGEAPSRSSSGTPGKNKSPMTNNTSRQPLKSVTGGEGQTGKPSNAKERRKQNQRKSMAPQAVEGMLP